MKFKFIVSVAFSSKIHASPELLTMVSAATFRHFALFRPLKFLKFAKDTLAKETAYSSTGNKKSIVQLFLPHSAEKGFSSHILFLLPKSVMKGRVPFDQMKVSKKTYRAEKRQKKFSTIIRKTRHFHRIKK